MVVNWKGCRSVVAVALKELGKVPISDQIGLASAHNRYNEMASLVTDVHGAEQIEALTLHGSLDVGSRAILLPERTFGIEPFCLELSQASCAASCFSAANSVILIRSSALLVPKISEYA